MKLKQVLGALVFSLSFTSCLYDPMANIFEDVEEAEMYAAPDAFTAPDPGDVIHVMTWNIKFGGGRIDFFWDCFDDRVNMRESEVLANLEGIAAKINQADPDILILQEVDVHSHRSANVHMVQWLLEHTSLQYGAYASHWRSDYIPSPGVFPDGALGNMDSGNAILSKWPLKKAIRIGLPERTDDDDLHHQFYLKRNMLQAEVEIPGHAVRTIVNTHTEAYATDGTKLKHIQAFEKLMIALAAQGVQFISGGDFNTPPPGTKDLFGYPDSVCTDPDYPPDDFRGQEEFMADLYANFTSAIPLDEYRQDNAPWWSFSSGKDIFWNRNLDHLFTNGKFVTGSALVHQSEERGGMKTMPLSDHAPLSVHYVLEEGAGGTE